MRIYTYALKTLMTATMLLCAALGIGAIDGIQHVLLKGETVYGLARKYGVSQELILEANNITDAGNLKAGQKLIIPSLYQVEKGDTLFSISKKLDIDMNEFRAANGLAEKNVIRVGQWLVLPLKTTTGALAVTSAGEDEKKTASEPKAVISSLSEEKTEAKQAVGTSAESAKNASGAGTSAAETAKAIPVAAKTETASGAAKSPVAPAPRQAIQDNPLTGPWPLKGDIQYLQGKVYGVTISGKPGDRVSSVASGTVVSAGPYRLYGRVAFIQAPNGYVYAYGGMDELSVRVGDTIHPGDIIGTIGTENAAIKPIAYFFVYKDNKAVDPARAPRS